MFILDGKPLSPDAAFSIGGIQYPANWLRLASAEEREAIGITEVPDPAPYDQRFYWGYDADGALIPKDHAQLVEQWVGQTRTTANTLLIPTDWYLVRQAETGASVPVAALAYRTALRESSDTKEAAVKATDTTESLAAYILGDDYPAWPSDTGLDPDAQSPNYRLFWESLVASTVYAAIREQSFVSLPMNTLATEFIALIGDAKAGRPNEAAIQASMAAILSTGTFTEGHLAELQAALAAGGLQDIYTLS
jgi:hypothetical protein